jgi:hypothetical protein
MGRDYFLLLFLGWAFCEQSVMDRIRNEDVPIISFQGSWESREENGLALDQGLAQVQFHRLEVPSQIRNEVSELMIVNLKVYEGTYIDDWRSLTFNLTAP